MEKTLEITITPFVRHNEDKVNYRVEILLPAVRDDDDSWWVDDDFIAPEFELLGDRVLEYWGSDHTTKKARVASQVFEVRPDPQQLLAPYFEALRVRRLLLTETEERLVYDVNGNAV